MFESSLKVNVSSSKQWTEIQRKFSHMTSNQSVKSYIALDTGTALLSVFV